MNQRELEKFHKKRKIKAWLNRQLWILIAKQNKTLLEVVKRLAGKYIKVKIYLYFSAKVAKEK